MRRKRGGRVQKKERGLFRSRSPSARRTRGRHASRLAVAKMQKRAPKFYEMSNGAGDTSASSQSFAERPSDLAGKDFGQMKRSKMLHGVDIPITRH